MYNDTMSTFLLKEAKERFLRYVQIDTTSDEHSGTHPSTEKQRNLGTMLKQELEALGLQRVELDDFCYVYATLPATEGISAPPITFCAHLDTTPSEPGANVTPVLHENYDGGMLAFPNNASLQLSPQDSPELQNYVGQTLITSSGDTLLGADDKAGIAEIMAALAAFQRFSDLPHPELRIVLTPDEEVGQGTAKIQLEKLGKYGYTLDGGEMGELEEECFDAIGAEVILHGINVHPGKAKNRMVNACAIATRFAAALPEFDTPEHTELREGFGHLKAITGDENRAQLSYILRDFDKERNVKRVELFQQLARTFELSYPGLRIEVTTQEQYRNMAEVLRQYPYVTEKARQALEAAGLPVIKKAIRGGTDGARLSFMGVPTPNLFTGGFLAHSKKEWIPEIALQKGAEVVVRLCGMWARDGEEGGL